MGRGPRVDERVVATLGFPRSESGQGDRGWPWVSRETVPAERDPGETAPRAGPPADAAGGELSSGHELAEPAPADQVPAVSGLASLPAAPAAEVVIPRPSGPRRAQFDRDEFETMAPEEPDEPTVSRETAETALPRPAHPRIIVVANQKGGVGKTTTAVNLAAALGLGGLDVLLIDLDPQGNASTALGIEHGEGTPGTYECLLGDEPIADHAVLSSEAPHLHVLPATIDLAGAEIELVNLVGRERRLLTALDQYLAVHPQDYVIIDCPPSLGLLTLNALVAAREILIPIQCEYYALEGVSQLMRTIDLVKGALNDDLKLGTVLLTMYDGRTRLSAQVAAEVRKHFPAETLSVAIPRSVRISEAPSYGQTVLTYHPESAGSVSYLQAAQEIARRGAEGNS